MTSWLTGPTPLRVGLGLLRHRAPILVIGKRVLVTRHADCLEVLTRDSDFTIAEINAERFDRVNGPFILGMERSPQHDREYTILREAVRRDDLERIRRFVAATAAELVSAAAPRGRIDVVGELARVVPVRLVGAYFGIPGPDEATMRRWLRDIFHECFLNITNDARVRQQAVRSGEELRAHMVAEITRRKAEVRAGEPTEDVLGRLLALQDAAHPWLDDDTIRRNLGGLIVGAVDTTSKFVALGIDELLRRPGALHQAQEASRAGQIETVRRAMWEAVRFNPHTPFVIRHCRCATRIATGTPRGRSIPAGSTVFVAIDAAHFDPVAFRDPGQFRLDRTVDYLHFGFGLHQCFGLAINHVQIPELAAALLRLRNLRWAAGPDGQILSDGPFPDRFILEFDGDTNGGGKP